MVTADTSLNMSSGCVAKLSAVVEEKAAGKGEESADNFIKVLQNALQEVLDQNEAKDTAISSLEVQVRHLQSQLKQEREETAKKD